jgi:hypothetical protein
MPETLRIIGSGTGKRYGNPMRRNEIEATDLRQPEIKGDEFGVMSLEPPLMNTGVGEQIRQHHEGTTA